MSKGQILTSKVTLSASALPMQISKKTLGFPGLEACSGVSVALVFASSWRDLPISDFKQVKRKTEEEKDRRPSNYTTFEKILI